jgi:hypothetical protein
MRDIEPIDPAEGGSGALVLADVHRAVNGLQVGQVYPAAELYARYQDAAKEAGRTPAHIVAFGQELSRQGHLRVKRRVGGGGRGRTGSGKQVSCWQLT